MKPAPEVMAALRSAIIGGQFMPNERLIGGLEIIADLERSDILYPPRAAVLEEGKERG